MFQRPGPYVDYHHGGGHPWYGFVMCVLLLALVALAAFSAWRLTHPATAALSAAAPPAAKPADPALGELRLRYARGEVTRDEYLQRLTDLGGVAPPSESPPSEA